MGGEGDKYALCIKGYLLHDLNFLLDVREARGGAGEKGERAKIYQKNQKAADRQKDRERKTVDKNLIHPNHLRLLLWRKMLKYKTFRRLTYRKNCSGGF